MCTEQVDILKQCSVNICICYKPFVVNPLTRIKYQFNCIWVACRKCPDCSDPAPGLSSCIRPPPSLRPNCSSASRIPLRPRPARVMNNDQSKQLLFNKGITY